MRAGIDIDVREIENGLVVKNTPKYTDDNADPKEYFCKPDQLQIILNQIWETEVKKIVDKIMTQDSGFDKDERAEAKRAAAAKPIATGKNINKLLQKAKEDAGVTSDNTPESHH